MASLPYIQLYISDYLADTAHLTTAQHGAYLLLIFNYWQKGHSLNNFNKRLANVARMSNSEWEETEPILQEFFIIDGDEWVHSRIEEDLAGVVEKCAKKSIAGKISANKRSTGVEQVSDKRSTNKIRIDKNINTKNLCASEKQKAPKVEEEFYSTAKGKRLVGNSLRHFESFWKAFDYPKGKASAADAWLAVYRPENVEAIIKGAEVEAIERPTIQANGKTPKWAQGWLTGRRWEDLQESAGDVFNVVLPTDYKKPGGVQCSDSRH